MSSKPLSWPAGYGLQRLVEIDSTNAEAARLAAKATGPIWITAERQSAGRGRRGRPWASPGGALAASLLLFPKGDPAQAALRSFVTALALDQAFQALGVPETAISLKWPNDVLLHGCKVAGILLESAGGVGALDHLVIGVGINLNEAPEGGLEPGALAPIALAQVLGRPVARDDMLTALAASYAVWEARFAAEGFAPIRDAWLARAARLGEAITARTPQRSTSGIFETIDPDGNLILHDGAARHAISAADVFF